MPRLLAPLSARPAKDGDGSHGMTKSIQYGSDISDGSRSAFRAQEVFTWLCKLPYTSLMVHIHPQLLAYAKYTGSLSSGAATASFLDLDLKSLVY